MVDGLIEAGFHVDLVNTAKVVQYEGLKHTNHRYNAFHLAHMMRLGILPTGYVYPKENRALRDLLRFQGAKVRSPKGAMFGSGLTDRPPVLNRARR